MRKKISLVLILLSGLFASFACADNSMPVVAAEQSAAIRQHADRIPQRGRLYRVRYQGNTAYLFGTIHVGKEAFFPLEPQVMRALAESSTLAVELDPRNTDSVVAAVQKHGMYANGTIETRLSRKSLADLQGALQKAGIPYEQVARMKPWMLANLLISIELERNGFSSAQGIETHLLHVAKTQTKTVEELESAEFQLSLFDDMSEAQQVEYLRENLVEIANGMASQKAARMMTAWGNADSNTFEQMLNEEIGAQSASSEFIRRTLLDKRNPAMAAKIETLIKKDKSTFVAVGLLHLIGAKGLPTLLRRRGYEVQKLY